MSDAPTNPMQAARRLARQELPRRFYKQAGVSQEGARFAVILDGRPAKTPSGQPLAVPSLRLAEALAAEWNAVSQHIDPGDMPITRIVNTAIDGVARAMAGVRDEIAKYAGSDLVCYRATEPEGLVAAQAKAWDPFVGFARDTLGVELAVTAGVTHIAQSPDAIAGTERALRAFDEFGLAALATATSLTGSAIIALALAAGRIDVEAAWLAAHVDEDWQMARWGADTMALKRRAARRQEMNAAALILLVARG